MNKLEQIKLKYKEILQSYQKLYNFNETIGNNFKEFNQLFLGVIPKEIQGLSVTIDKRNEYDIFSGILTQISGEYNKLKANTLEEKYKKLFEHRDRVVNVFLQNQVKLPKKKTPQNPYNIKPDYGYHRD